MNKVIEITIRNKVARIASSPIIVGKNKDYIVRFDFDEDWDKYDTKTARFSQDGEYQDIIFAGNECSMPALDGGKVVEVGVYAGNISTTAPAYLKVHKSIIDEDGVPADPTPDVYAQLMERFNAMEAPAAVLYTAQELTNEQKATARENIGVATPDWDQNDATAADYVKNRTHYTESVYGIVGAGYNGWAKVTKYAAVPITKMSVLGVIYKNVPVAAENDAVVEYVVGDHRLSFDRQYNMMTATPNNIDDYNVVFYGYLATVVHKLPIEYIPNEVALTQNLPQSDWNEKNQSSASFIRNKPSPSDVTPSAPGTAAAGESTDYARADHVHPRELPECSDADAGKVLTVAGNADVQWQLPSAGADISLGMTGATVGQIAKIAAVDTPGKPTSWEAVDMPSGGGEYKLLYDDSISVENVNAMQAELSQSCEGMTEFAYEISWTKNGNIESGNDSMMLYVGDGRIDYGRLCDPTTAGYGTGIFKVLKYNGKMKSIFCNTRSAHDVQYNAPHAFIAITGPYIINVPYYDKWRITTFSVSYTGTISLKLWGR